MGSNLLNCKRDTDNKKKAAIDVAHRYPTRSEVENANNTRLAQIMEKPVQFDAVDYPGYHRDGTRVSFQEMKRLLDRLVALPTLVLKVIPVACCCYVCLMSARLAH